MNRRNGPRWYAMPSVPTVISGSAKNPLPIHVSAVTTINQSTTPAVAEVARITVFASGSVANAIKLAANMNANDRETMSSTLKRARCFVASTPATRSTSIAVATSGAWTCSKSPFARSSSARARRPSGTT